MENNRNTFLAIALSLVIIVAWQYLYVSPKLEAERQSAEAQRRQIEQSQSTAQDTAKNTGQSGATTPGAGSQQAASEQATTTTPSGTPSGTPGQAAPQGGGDVPVSQALSRDAALAASPRVPIDNSHVVGSINLKGGRIDDLRLKKYRVSVKPNSDLVTLLSPSQLKTGYFTELGYVGSGSSGDVPGPDTVWTAPEGAELTKETPVTLTWTNSDGVTFKRTISIDDGYMFTVDDTVTNDTGHDITLSPYGRVTRFFKPAKATTYILHEGLIGVFGKEGLEQTKYKKLEDEREITSDRVDGGWLGITDKYWAATLVPSAGYKPRFSYFDDGRARWQADYLGDPLTIAAGKNADVQQRIFAGAKEVNVVDNYEKKYDILNFELLIDWGWFYFITKPMFWLLDTLYKLVGNFGIAILLATVIIKAALFPLANMSYKSMANMKKLQPEITAMRERFADDKVKQQQEMMALYKREKINPAAGCWPMLIQIPIFFSLYKVLYITIEMRHAPFFGWIQDLSAPDPTSIVNLFGLLPFDAPAFAAIGVFPLIMGFTMFLQMQMNPTPPDPTQAMIFKWMPIVFTFMLASFPAGLVIYWTWNNTLSIIQQGIIMKRNGVKIELFDNLRGLFGKKPKPAE
ncbi:MAG: membrane protein insertase YidC [Salaquimonas sp.]|nr:membrane protein insertase YidC [Salaquimonas sp.]